MAVVDKENRLVVLLDAINCHTRHAAVAWLEHGDVIDGFAVSIVHLKRLPIRRDARRYT
jgi:hypothetical protein